MPDNNADNQDQNNSSDNQDQQEDKSWRSTLPDEIKDSPDLVKFDDVPALAQSYINASKLIGRDKIPMPKSEAEWEETFNRLGRPEDKDKYDIEVSSKLPKQAQEQLKTSLPWFKQVAHSIGLNNTQASKFINDYATMVAEHAKIEKDKVNTAMAEAKVELDTMYGDKLPAKMVLANRAIDRFGGQKLIDLFTETGLGRDPRVVKAFIEIGELIAEDVGLDKHGEPLESMEDLDEKINSLMTRPAYIDPMDPAHNSLVNQVQGLMKRRHPKPGM